MRVMPGVLVLAMAAPILMQAAMAQTTISPPPAALGQTAPPTTIPGPAKLATPLPEPPLPEGASVEEYLMAAQHAIGINDERLARGALEQAETRALTRSVRPSLANVPEKGGLIGAISATRAALDRGDWAGANASLARALELAKKKD